MNEDMNPNSIYVDESAEQVNAHTEGATVVTGGQTTLKPGQELSVQDTSTNLVVNFDYKRAVMTMPAEKKEMYLRRAHSKMKSDDVRTIQQYGVEVNKIISRVADSILDKTKSDKTIDSVELMNSMMTEIQGMKVPSAEPAGFWGKFRETFRGWPILGSWVKKAEETAIQRSTVGKNIRDISEKFMALKSQAMSDDAFCDDLRTAVQDYIVKSRDETLTMQIFREEVQSQLAVMENEKVVNLDDLQKLRNADIALSKRIADMTTVESVLQQNLYEIAALQGNFSAIIDKAETAVNFMFPIAKGQLAIGIITHRQKQGVDMMLRADQFLNDLLTQNSETLKQSSIALAQATETPSLRQETIEKTADILIEMVDAVKEIRANGEAKRQEILDSVQKCSERLNSAVRSASMN